MSVDRAGLTDRFSLLRLQDRLLVQCTTGQVDQVLHAAQREGTGVVITAGRAGGTACLVRTEHLLKVGGYRRPVLVDAARYAGDRRLPASAPFDPDWISRQRHLGLPVLTDSGYVAARDDEGLWSILVAAAKLGDAIALLPMHVSWLADPAARAILLRHVRTVGVPIAVVVEHPTDPFGAAGAVQGLMELLGTGVPALVLRCDVSALGALCSGAIAAAVGTMPSLRHLYPARAGGSIRMSRRRVPSAIVPQCLSYKRLTQIASTRRKHPDTGMWRCDCETCEGRELDWMLSEPEQVQGLFAFEHSLDVLLDLRDDLVGHHIRRRQLSWRARCSVAASRGREVGWDSLPMLHRWQEAIVALPRRARPVGGAASATARRADRAGTRRTRRQTDA